MCPCGTGTAYAACCGRFHTGTRRPPTALALMRSRYSAFALGLPDYLIDTWHPATRPADLTWDADTHWQALEILATTDGRAWQEEGTVTFAASWDSPAGSGVLRERSRFVRRIAKCRWVSDWIFPC